MYLLLKQQFHLFFTRMTNIGQVLSIQLSQLPTAAEQPLIYLADRKLGLFTHSSLQQPRAQQGYHHYYFCAARKG